MSLDARLQSILDAIQGFDTVYDIGTDHAFLPIEAVKQGIVSNAVAVDNKKGPASLAQRNIKAAGFEDRIRVIVADGLNALDETCDVAVMAGVGGATIRDVFKDHDTLNLKRFVFQPNTHVDRVRMLTDYGYRIIDETVVHVQGVYYVIIVMEKGTMRLNEHTRLFGPILLKKRPKAFLSMLESERDYIAGALASLPKHVKAEALKKRLLKIEEVLYEGHRD